MSRESRIFAISCMWLAWVGVTALLTARLLIWHVDYFKSPGPQFYKAALFFLPVLVLGSLGYAWLRRKLLWQFEPLAFAAIAAAAILYYEPRALLTCLALFLASYYLGAFAGDKLRLKLPGPVDRIIVRCGLGCGLLIPALFVLGEFRLFYRGVFVAVLLAPIAFRFREASTAVSDLWTLHKAWKNSAGLRHPMAGIGIAFGFIAMLCTLMVALAPSVTFDTLSMHLPSVQHYVSAHSISTIPQIAYSYYPQGGEVLWTVAYSLAGQPGTQIESVVFFVLFLLVVYRLARECASDHAAAVVGTIWASTLPFLHWTGSVMKNDMIMTFFQALAVYTFVRWLADRRFQWIVAGAFFLAQSFGIKHVALFGAVPLAIFYGYAVWKQPQRWKAAALVTFVFLLFGTFWIVRTYLLTGNPTYPEAPQHAVSGAVGAHGHSLADRALRYAKLPGTILFDGNNTFESPLPSPAGIALFAFLPLAFFGRQWRNKAMRVCFAFAVIYLFYWSTIVSTLRYAIVPFAILAVLVAAGTARFYDAIHAKLVRSSVLVLEVYCLLFAVLAIMIVEVNGPQIAYFGGRLDKSGYLHVALRTYGSLEYLQRAAQPGAAIFGIDNCSSAYAPDPVQFQCVLCSLGGCNTAALAARFNQYPPRYVIVPDGDAGMVGDLDRGQTWSRIYRDEYFSVYQLP